MNKATEPLDNCARLVNTALLQGAQAGVAPIVLDSLLDVLRVISIERGEDGAPTETLGFDQ